MDSCSNLLPIGHVTLGKVFQCLDFSFFKIYILLIVLLQLCYYICPIFSPLHPHLPGTPIPSSLPPNLSSCSWVIHVHSLASPFPILFLTFPCLFSTNSASYSLYLFPHSHSTPSRLITLHLISISVILFLF